MVVVVVVVLLLFLLSPATHSTPWPSWRRHAHGDAAQAHACRKSGGYDVGGETRWVPSWRPARGRYLVMICTSGQVSNRLVCLRKHMYFAALLNRTLVLPPGSVDYQYDHLLDIAHLQRCLASATNSTHVVMTFQEFQVMRGANLHVDELICYMHDCYFDKEHQTKWEALGFTFGPCRDAWVTPKTTTTTTTTPRRESREEIVARFGGGEEQDVIAVGDLFYADVEDSGGFEVASQCRGMVRPHRSIATAAERFVQTYLGGNFVAVHFRRHGFLVFCNRQVPGPSCFYPIPQAARCIERAVRAAAAADVVFLSTDAPESEATALVAALARRGVDVVRRSAAHEPLAKWDAPLWRLAPNREAEPGVMALVDQTICALAATFIGTRSSSFSAHIQHLRHDMLTASTCDAPICHNLGPPSFQAPTEP